jgi:hypothetical protein
MRFFRRYNKGWYNDSYRHSLAAKGIKTRFALNGQQLMPPSMPPVTEQRKMTKLAVDYADGSITAQELANRKDLSSQEVSLILDEANRIGAERQYAEVLKQKARKVWEAPVGPRREERGAAAIPTARKIEEEEKTEEELAAEQRLPFSRWLTRVRSGDFTGPEPPLNESEKLAQRAAVIDGVQAKIDRGDLLKASDWQDLEKTYGLSHPEINRLKAYQHQELPSLLRKAGRVTGAEALKIEEATTGFLKKGWGSLKEKVQPSISEISGGNVDEELKKIEAKKKEIEGAAGVFNPWKILDESGGSAKLKEEKKKQIYADAISAQRDLDALFENKEALAKADLSGYNKGEKAFRKGDREMLLDAITELDAQHMKLQDRMWHVEAVRGNILNKQTMDHTIAMASDDGKIMPNFLFGSGGGNAIVKQTKKVNQIKESIKKSSNEVAGRLAMLRNKLKRMDATVPPQAPVPEAPVKVFRKTQGLEIITSFDDFEGQLKHQNPVLEGIQRKEIKNPALRKLDEGGEQ